MFKKLFQMFLGEPEGFISEADKFMAQNRKKLSESQKKEIAKHQAIADKRGENM